MSNKINEYAWTMPQDFLSKWIEALRNPENFQGQGQLGNYYEGYCCLGLAGSIAGIDDMYLGNYGTLAEIRVWEDREPSFHMNDYPVPSCLVDSQLARENSGKEVAYGVDLVNFLMTMNDDGGYSFPEIADFLERNVEPV